MGTRDEECWAIAIATSVLFSWLFFLLFTHSPPSKDIGSEY
jgi:hypothetical protein